MHSMENLGRQLGFANLEVRKLSFLGTVIARHNRYRIPTEPGVDLATY